MHIRSYNNWIDVTKDGCLSLNPVVQVAPLAKTGGVNIVFAHAWHTYENGGLSEP